MSAGSPCHESGYPAEMRDGTVLRATVLRPARSGRFPTLVLRTPYGAERALTFRSLFDRALAGGYALVVQDVRGRYASDGVFDPYRQEGADGYDTIEWAAVQPWSDGRIGTFGLSYPAAAQWLAALERPPHLLAMVPAMTFARPRHFWFAGGLRDMSWLSWIWLYIAPEERRRRGLPGPRTFEEAQATWQEVGPALLARRPLRDVPELAGVAPWYLEWLAHPDDDPWWSWAELSDRYHRIDAAVLNLSGWHDESYGPRGATENHAGLARARDGADARSRLVVGPWTHGVPPADPESPEVRTGERLVGPRARFDFAGETLRFMDHHLCGRPEVPAPAPVRVFVMGENRWLAADRWPLEQASTERWYLGSDGSLTLGPAPQSGELELVCDRMNPVRDRYGVGGAHDYRDLGSLEGTLTFETSPLDTACRIVGPIVVELYVEAAASESALCAKLLHVERDGTAWNLMSPGADIIRVGPRSTSAAAGSAAQRVRLDGLLTANRFAPGDRIRIVLSTGFAPHFARDSASGEEDGRPVRLRIRFGVDNPSHLALPVILGAGPTAASSRDSHV